MEKITGLTAAEVLGKYAFDLFPFLVKEGIDQLYYSSLRGEVSARSKIMRYSIRSTGLSGYTQQQNLPLFNELGEVTGGMAIIRDVTAVKQKFDELHQTNLRLAFKVEKLKRLLNSAKIRFDE